MVGGEGGQLVLVCCACGQESSPKVGSSFTNSLCHVDFLSAPLPEVPGTGLLSPHPSPITVSFLQM